MKQRNVDYATVYGYRGRQGSGPKEQMFVRLYPCKCGSKNVELVKQGGPFYRCRVCGNKGPVKIHILEAKCAWNEQQYKSKKRRKS